MVIVKTALPALASPGLTLKDAEMLVNTSVRFLAGVEHLHRAAREAMQHKDFDPAVVEAAAKIGDL